MYYLKKLKFTISMWAVYTLISYFQVTQYDLDSFLRNQISFAFGLISSMPLIKPSWNIVCRHCRFFPILGDLDLMFQSTLNNLCYESRMLLLSSALHVSNRRARVCFWVVLWSTNFVGIGQWVYQGVKEGMKLNSEVNYSK